MDSVDGTLQGEIFKKQFFPESAAGRATGLRFFAELSEESGPKSSTNSSHDPGSSSSRHGHTPSTSGTFSPRIISTHAAYTSHTHYSHAVGAYPSQSSHIDNSTVLPGPGGRVSRPFRNRFNDAQLSPIAKLVIGNKETGVMGIVKYFKSPYHSKGSDFCTSFSVIDDSQNNASLSCVLFNPHKNGLPIICCPGEVLMIKGLTINTYQTALQGVGHESSLVGLFSIDLTLPSPETIGNWYNMKAMEKSRLHQLKKWAATTELPLLINSKLEEISVANYCSSLCVVVAVHRAPVGSRGVVLTVTDGTVPRHPLATDTSSLKVLSNDPDLHYRYQGITSTVMVSTASRPHVTAGDVVQLVNLCMVKMSDRAMSSQSASDPTQKPEAEEVMKLVIEDHPSFQGALKVQHSDSTVACSFMSKIAIPEGPQPSWRPVQSLSTKVLHDKGELATLKHIQSTALVGSVHVVKVKVVGLGRSVCSKLEDMAQLRCPRCKTLYLTPQPQAENYLQLLCAGDLCVCCCPEDGIEEDVVEEDITLCFMFAFTLLVVDHTTQIEVAVSGSEGSKFLHQEPANLYSDIYAKDALLSLMYQMTGGNDPFHPVPLDPRFSQPYPLLKLCITVATSYSGKRMYKLTNTILLQDGN